MAILVATNQQAASRDATFREGFHLGAAVFAALVGSSMFGGPTLWNGMNAVLSCFIAGLMGGAASVATMPRIVNMEEGIRYRAQSAFGAVAAAALVLSTCAASNQLLNYINPPNSPAFKLLS